MQKWDVVGQAEEIAARRWAEPEMEAAPVAQSGYGPGGPSPRPNYRLWVVGGGLAFCHICGSTDRWELAEEGRHYLCDHGLVQISFFSLRRFSSISLSAVARAEQVSGPDLTTPVV